MSENLFKMAFQWPDVQWLSAFILHLDTSYLYDHGYGVIL